ncbi:MAG: protein kinase [Polyangiaceae bacterium]|nr:protein kinase [Polyangiaceae bacterium]
MDFLRSDVGRYAIAGIIVVILLMALRRVYVWYSGREERELAEQVRAAIDAGDLRLAGDLQLKRGLLVEASRIFQRAGEHARAGAVLLRLGEEKKAAEEFELAEEWARAAPLYRKTGELLKAGNCYERSGGRADQIAAAECLQHVKEYLRAGRLYQVADEYERAAECFAKVEDLDALDSALTMLENAALAKKTDPARKTELWKSAAEMATKLGAHERAARAWDEAGEHKKAARIYEEPLKKYDLAAALYQEAGDTESARRMVVAAGGEGNVAKTRLARARARGDERLVDELTGASGGDTKKGSAATAATMLADDDKATNVTVKHPSGDSGQRGGRAAPVVNLEDRFELLGELGRGGMGIVHRARDLRLGRFVALKFLPDDVEPGSTLHRLFHREARAAAALTHPGIVTVYDVGTLGDREFIAMELVDGTTLDRVLDDTGPLAVGEAVDLMEKVLGAVEYAHQKSIIHRDLKPANLMRTKDGIKVMDFGLAKVVNSKSSGGGTVVGGTPNYMPPEQREGNSDHRADVFALGATFYELLTGVLPGNPGEPASISATYPTPRQRVSAIPARLSDLIMRCLERDRAERPQDVVSVLRELREIRADLAARPTETPRKRSPEPVAAPSPSPVPAPSPVRADTPKKRAPVERIAREEEDEAPRPERIERPARPARIAREDSDPGHAGRVDRVERVERVGGSPAAAGERKPPRKAEIVEVVDMGSRRGKPR